VIQRASIVMQGLPVVTLPHCLIVQSAPPWWRVRTIRRHMVDT